MQLQQLLTSPATATTHRLHIIDLGKESTGGSSDNYAVVLKNVEKKTGTANGTVYIITAWNGTEQITVTTG